MLQFLIKVVISAFLIAAIAEVAKRSDFLAAILASIPLISVLGIIWLYIDTKSIAAVSELSKAIFWMVIPSLIFFVTLPLFLKLKMNFAFSMILSLAIMVAAYFLMILLLRQFAIKI